VKSPEDPQEVLSMIDSRSFLPYPSRVPGSEAAVLQVRYNKMILP
jgi:hypothetical protein